MPRPSRIARQFRLPRSQLVRPGDRLEVAARWLVLLVVLISVPFALAAGSEVGASVARSITIEHAERRPVPAEVLAPTTPDSSPSSSERRNGPVRWTAPDGSPRVGRTVLTAVQLPGDTVAVWMDARGELVPRPRSTAEAPTHGAMAALGLIAVTSASGLLILFALRLVLDRRHLRAWEVAWRRLAAPGANSAL